MTHGRRKQAGKEKARAWARLRGYSGQMRVKVLYFGVLRDMCGVSDEMAELADGATVGELLRILRAKASNQAMSDSVESGTDSGTDSDSDSKARLWRSLAVAVNREYCSPAVVLRDGDEVALLPPVSGGSFAEGGTARTAKSSLRSQKRRRCGFEEALAMLAKERCGAIEKERCGEMDESRRRC